LVALHYTQAHLPSQLEIFIFRIRFSDASASSIPGQSASKTFRTVRFVQFTLQRIMPCGMANGHPDPARIDQSTAMTDRLPMEINVRDSGGVSVLEVQGRLTIGEPAEQLHDALESVVKAGAKRVVVVLNGIPQIDSSGISTLVRISIKLAREGGVLRLVCGHGRVRDALTVTRLIEAIPTFESESAALANF
jgi:anti-anti-sigma factor